MRSSRLAFLALALVAPLVLSGAVALGQAAEQEPQLKWSPCKDVKDAQCTFIKVPVDHAKPDGTTFALRLGLMPAHDPALRKGMLLFIPGQLPIVFPRVCRARDVGRQRLWERRGQPSRQSAAVNRS